MKINVYTIPNCPYCTKLKDLLNSEEIPYDIFDVSVDNEEVFEQLCELSGSESVPMVTVGKHLLAPDVNFHTIEDAFKLIKHIIENESE